MCGISEYFIIFHLLKFENNKSGNSVNIFEKATETKEYTRQCIYKSEARLVIYKKRCGETFSFKYIYFFLNFLRGKNGFE